jgi:peptidoglycan/LPS O-acetylase OafA/YrhL
MGSVCWLVAFGGLVLKGLVLPGDYGVQQGHWLVPQLCYTLFAFLIVVPFVLGRDGESRVHALADTRVMVFLGTISYGIFLWHEAVIHWIDFQWLPRASTHSGYTLIVVALTLAATIPIATASWFLIERPALGLKQRIDRT